MNPQRPETSALHGADGAWNGGTPPGGSRLPWQPTPSSAALGQRGTPEHALQILRERKWIVIQALIIVPAIVMILTLRQEDKYTATANLLFRQPAARLLAQDVGTQGGGQADSPERDAATNEQLVDLPVVAKRAAKAVGGGVTSGDVGDAISIDAPGDADLLKIQAEYTQPELAAKIANAYGRSYISFRREADRAQIDDAVKLLQRNLASLTPAEQAGSTGRNLRQRIRRLRLERQLQTGNAELVQQATASSSPSSPSLKRNFVLALLLGGVFGFGLAALRDRLDSRVRMIGELEDLYELPILAKVPKSRALAKQERGNSQALREVLSFGEEAEAFRALRANLRYFNVDRRDVRSILVTSPLPGDGKSLVARHLAVTMASLGDRVCLLDADLHKRDSDRFLFAPRNEGLSLVLAGFDLDEALTEVPISYDVVLDKPRNLVTLGSGPLPPNPSELLESKRMRWLMNELESRFDIVIVDSPPVSSFSDALSLVTLTSGAIVVNRLGQTARSAALELRKQMALVGAKPLGLVANGWTPERTDPYYTYERPPVTTA